MDGRTTAGVDLTQQDRRQGRRSSRLVEYAEVHKGDMVIDWDNDDSSDGQPPPESFSRDLEEAGEVSTITDTAAESSLFTYASSSKQCNSNENRLAAANFLETIRESVLLNNSKSQGQQQCGEDSSSAPASTTSNATKISLLTHHSLFTHRGGSEVTSTTGSSSSTHDGILKIKHEQNDGMTKSTLYSSTEESSTEQSIESCIAAPNATTPIPLPQPMMAAKSNNTHPFVVIHSNADDVHNDDHADVVSLSASSHCSASTHSTISTNIMTQPSYEDVEKSLMKEESFAKKTPEQEQRLHTYFCCLSKTNEKDSHYMKKALLIGCFFGLSIGLIIIFSYLILHNKH
jgi:hypothetical protein